MKKFTVLVLEDDSRLLEELSEYLMAEGFLVIGARCPSAAMARVGRDTIDIAIIDIKLPEYDGIQFLKKLKRIKPDIEAIMMSGHGDMESVIEAMREGAFDYLRKPFSPLDMQISVERTIKYIDANGAARKFESICNTLQEEITAIGNFSLIGKSQALIDVVKMLDAAAAHPGSPVLITGESGTGKELVARLIHLKSTRKNAKFLPINCAAVPDHLFESEFFGHEKGSFTDARDQRDGFFRTAHGGTLFLDEIGDMSYAAQTKLLRVVEDETVKPVGSDEEVSIDTRLICATNRPVKEMIEQKRFRLDFYHRIAVVGIHIPPLRDRPEDIPLLAAYFLENLGQKMGKKNLVIDPDSLDRISSYHFPGNVRELKNIIEKAIILGDDPIILTPQYMGESALTSYPFDEESFSNTSTGELNLENLEKAAITKALELSGLNFTKASILLGLSRQALDRRMIKYGIARCKP